MFSFTRIIHPIVKLIALIILISWCLVLICAWLGLGPSALTNILSGCAAYGIAEFILSDAQTQQARLHQAIKLIRANGATTAKMTFLVMIFIVCYSLRTTPSEPPVKLVLGIVETFGLVAVMIHPVTRGILITMRLANSATVLSYIATSFIKGLATYSIALWLIGKIGDDTFNWIMANPTDTAAGMVSLVIVWFIASFSLRGTPSSAIASASTSATAGFARMPFPSDRDNRYTAAHEAAHTMVYAALGTLPTDFKVVMKDLPDRDGVLGFVTGVNSDHQLDGKTFAEWKMLVFLAGKIGESVMFEETTLGSGNDHLRWLETARPYLANHYRGVFYAEPQNKFEQKQNDSKLEALLVEQVAALKEFFDLNVQVLKDLTDNLLEKRTIDRDGITPILSRAKFPDGFPRHVNW